MTASPFAIAFVQPAAPTTAEQTPAPAAAPTRVRESAARSDRSLICRIAAAERWAKEPNRTKATAAARAGLEARFKREVDPDGVLPPDELARRVKSAKTAYYTRLARSRRRPAA